MDEKEFELFLRGEEIQKFLLIQAIIFSDELSSILEGRTNTSFDNWLMHNSTDALNELVTKPFKIYELFHELIHHPDFSHKHEQVELQRLIETTNTYAELLVREVAEKIVFDKFIFYIINDMRRILFNGKLLKIKPCTMD